MPSATQPAVHSLPAGAERRGVLVAMLGAYTLMCTVPIAELLVTHVGIHIPIVIAAQVVLTLGLLTVGRLGEFWKTPVAKPYMAVLFLMGLAAAFAFYHTASIELYVPYALRFHILPFYFCAIAVTTKQVRRAFSWMGWGAFLLLALSFAYGRVTEDRFGIPETTLSNPNDLGFAILFVMTGLLVLQSKVSRVLVVLSLPLFFVYLLKTGSRADMLTLACLIAIGFYFAPWKWKMITLLAMPVVGVAVLTVVPQQTLARLATIVVNPMSAASKSFELEQALASQAARLQLQERAIALTLRHPFLGVGVNNFESAVEVMVQETLHEKSGWQVAHNTYLQMAAENGIPAFIFYVWSLILCLKMNIQSYRTCRKTPQLSGAVTQSFALILTSLMFMVCTAFSNNSCDPHLGVLVGLTAANYLAVKRESGEVPQAGPVPVMRMAQPRRARPVQALMPVPAQPVLPGARRSRPV